MCVLSKTETEARPCLLLIYLRFNELQFPGLCEGAEAAVVGFLHLIRETAAGQLLHPQVISKTVAAYSLFVTARVRAVAIAQILLFLAFHNSTIS
jgi:hypothetical protein